MKLKLNKDETLYEDKIDIQYRKMTPTIKQVVRIVKSSSKHYEIVGKCEDGKNAFINADDVFYLESVDKKTFMYTKEDVYEVQEPLTHFENELRSFGYIRVNKSVVINIYHIESIKPEINMRVTAIMENGEKLMINRSYKRNFVEFLKERREMNEKNSIS